MIHVVVPNLLTLPPGVAVDALPPLLQLQQLLSKSENHPQTQTFLARLLFDLANVSMDAALDAPVGPVSFYGDSGEVWPEYCFCADPVHLHADRDQLVLFDSASLAIETAEAEQLISEFNEFFQNDGLSLSMSVPDRWYLHVKKPPALRTYATYEVVGKHIDPFLPVGSEASHWHALFNEIQMLFHQSSINWQRQSDGKPMINSVWLWGGGSLPNLGSNDLSRVYTDEPIAAGLAAIKGVPYHGIKAFRC